jgi:hypothetical protein
MNISQPSPHVPGVRPLPETNLNRPEVGDSTRPEQKSQAAGGRSLWEILTPEEREFFEQQAPRGPLTYRPGSGQVDRIPAPTGRSIDVRG